MTIGWYEQVGAQLEQKIHRHRVAHKDSYTKMTVPILVKLVDVNVDCL